MTIQSTKLTNFQIKELLDKYSNQYFVIINNDNPDEAHHIGSRYPRLDQSYHGWPQAAEGPKIKFCSRERKSPPLIVS